MSFLRRFFESSKARARRLAAEEARLLQEKQEQEKRRLTEESQRKAEPLLKAAAAGDIATVKTLLRDGFSPNAKGSGNHTPLEKAATNGCLEVVTLLLNAGADVNAADSGGTTPLHWAALNGHYNVCSVLLRCGASASARDSAKDSPLDYAVSFCTREGVNEQFLKLLLVHPEDGVVALNKVKAESAKWVANTREMLGDLRRRTGQQYSGWIPNEDKEKRRQDVIALLQRLQRKHDRRSNKIRQLLIFKMGASRTNDTTYLKSVLEAIGLSPEELEGTHLEIRSVESPDLTQSYVIGFATEMGYDLTKCTLTPFADADGGQGMVLKVMDT